MKRKPNNSMLRYLLVLCLSVTLLTAQNSQLHVHNLHHDDHGFSNNGHIVDVHSAATQHGFDLIAHQDEYEKTHDTTAVDIETSAFVKNSDSLNPLILVLLLIGLLLYIPRVIGLFIPWIYRTFFTFNYSSVRPPLRAPPLS